MAVEDELKPGADAAGTGIMLVMTDEIISADCFVCDKHRGESLMPGGPMWADDLVVVSHLSPKAPGSTGTVYLGHLLVEPRRHTAGLGDLTDAEAQRVGLWCTRAARSLRDVAGAERVYSAVIGNRVPHLHIHLIPRYPGTPHEYGWDRVDEWPGAPRGGEAEAAALVERLRCLPN